MKRVLLLMDSPDYKEFVADFLKQECRVTIAESDAELDQAFDLCIMDALAYIRLWKRVGKRKQEESPVLLPLLLIVKREHLGLATRYPIHGVDELVVPPVDAETLRARVNILFRERDYSLAFKHRADAVTAKLKRLNSELNERIDAATVGLEKERQRLLMVIDQMPAGVIITEAPSGKFVFSNKRIETIWRRPLPETMTVESYKQFKGFRLEDNHPYDPEDWPLVRSATRGEVVIGEEVNIIRGDGSPGTVKVNSAPIRDSKERIAGAVAVILDVTKEKELEIERLALSKRLDSTINAATDAIIGCEDNGRFIASWNKAAEQMFGFSQEEAIGKPLNRLIPERLQKAHRLDIDRFLSSGELAREGKTFEFEAKKKDGTEFPVELSYGAWRQDGETQFVVVIRDISARRERARLSEALNDISSQVSSTLESDVILRNAISVSARAINAEAAVLLLRQGEVWTNTYAYNLPAEIIGVGYATESLPYGAASSRTQKPVLAQGPGESLLLRSIDARSALVVPLVVRDETIGLLYFVNRTKQSMFTNAHVDFADRLATSVSLALQNARLYERERAVANTLQESILAVPEEIADLNVGRLYRSATEAVEVGGDFYDLFNIDQDSIGIVIGDISGKGLQAATLTSLVKDTIRAYAYIEKSPARIIARANNAVFKRFPPGLFVTVFFAILSRSTGRLSYCNAGHPPPIIRRGSGSARFVEKHSAVIGALENVLFAEAGETLHSGDLLILYTDGVIEVRRQEKKLYDQQGLIRLVSESGLLPPDSMTRAIYDKTLALNRGKLPDDIAILSLEFKPTEAEGKRYSAAS